MELKNITNVTKKETPDMTEHVIVEDKGQVKRIPISAIGGGGGGSGTGFDLVITANAAPEEESGESGDYIPFIIDPESINIETSLSFDELKAKWFYYSCIISVDCSNSGYIGELESDPRVFGSNFFNDNFMSCYWSSLSSEMAGSLAELGVDVAEGDSAFLISLNDSNTPIYPSESGEGDSDYIEVNFGLILTRGNDGEIVGTFSDEIK